MSTETNSLLEELKSNLRITWEDENKNLGKILDRCKAYLESKTGTSLDFEEDLVVRELILERARYVYNNAADEFAENYKKDIVSLQVREAIKKRRSADDTHA